MKQFFTKRPLSLALLLLLIFSVACSGGNTGDLESVIEEAAEQVEEVADQVAENAEEIAKEAEEVVETVVEEVSEAVATEEPAPEEEAASEEEAAPEEEAVADLGYDADVYGNMDEIDLNGAEVVFWHRYDSGGRQEAIDQIIADFNATNEYGITVVGSAEGHYGQIYDKMIAALTTGDVPGMVIAYQNQAAAYQVADGLVSLDPYINHPTYGLSEDDSADFFQAFIDGDRLPQFGGESFGFPGAGRSMEVLYYNMDWLAELGYDAPPSTPAEFAEMACAATETPFSGNTSDFSAGMELDTDASSLAALVFARGGDIYDYANNQFSYDTPEAIEALTMMQGLVADGCIQPLAERYGDQTDFGNGKILFTQGSSSGLPFYVSAVDDGEAGGFEWSVAPIPYTTAEPVQNLYGASASITKSDPTTQLAAWMFMKYWTSPEVQATWVENSNYFPSRDSVAGNLEGYIAENAAFGAAFDLLQYGKPEAPVAGYDNVRDVAEEAFISIVFDGADAAEALAGLDQEANKILAEAAPDGMPPAPAAEEAEEEAAAPAYDEAVYGNIDEVSVDGVEVVFWHRYDSGGRQEAIDQIIADFNATNEYGITVVGSAEGHYGQIYDKMIAALTTGDVPGMVIAYQNQAAAYQVADGLVSLDPYINHATYGLDDGDRADFFQAFIDGDRLPQFGGESFGFPGAGRSMEVLYYNMDWLAELGYDAPPSTPAEFAEMACAATETPFSGNTSDFSAGMEIDTDASSLAALVFARGGDIFDYENNQFSYNTPEAIEALTTIQELVADGCIQPLAERYGDQTDFGNGKILFTQGSSSGLPFYVSAVNDGEAGGFEWSVAPIPHTTAEPVQNLYGASASVTKTDPSTQLAAWLFMKYWTSPEVQATWVENSNYFPSRDSVAGSLGDYITENAAFGTAFDLLQYGKPEAPVAGYDNVRDVAEEAFISIIFDGSDAAETLAGLDEQANQILAEAAP